MLVHRLRTAVQSFAISAQRSRARASLSLGPALAAASSLDRSCAHVGHDKRTDAAGGGPGLREPSASWPDAAARERLLALQIARERGVDHAAAGACPVPTLPLDARLCKSEAFLGRATLARLRDEGVVYRHSGRKVADPSARAHDSDQERVGLAAGTRAERPIRRGFRGHSRSRSRDSGTAPLRSSSGRGTTQIPCVWPRTMNAASLSPRRSSSARWESTTCWIALLMFTRCSGGSSTPSSTTLNSSAIA